MRWLQGGRRVLGGGLLLMLLVPSLAAWPSALIDRGSDGSARVSIFPAALAAFDPFLWTCAQNSVMVALVVVAGSLVIGVGLGSIAGRRRSWIRGVLWALALSPLAAGPLLIAPSFEFLLGGRGGWDWLATRSIAGVPVEGLVRWAALIWTELAWGVPLVALASSRGLKTIDATWIDAALAMGASRRQAWRDIVWPILRPGVGRALAQIFTIALVEPAGPIVLGLRRTLAVQIIETATRLDQPTRASAIALLAIAIAVVGRSLIARWGGMISTRGYQPGSVAPPPVGFAWRYLATMLLAAWCGVTAGPMGWWFWQGFRLFRIAIPDNSLSLISGSWRDPDVLTWAMNSLVTAGLAVLVDLVILGALAPRLMGSTSRVFRLSCRMFEAIPPLALATGALCTPWLLRVLADSTGEPFDRGLSWLALELSPARSPGFMLILVLAGVQMPMLAEVAGRARGLIRPSLVSASRLMGESDRRAFRSGRGRWLGVIPISTAFLAFTLASTSLAPALLLSPMSERRTLASGVFTLLLEPGPLDPRALGPIAVLFGINLLAIALASRGQISPSGSLGPSR